MQTLFLEKADLTLRGERACLLVYEAGKPVGSVPLKSLERVVLSPQITLAAGVLGMLSEHGIALLVVNHRHPERSAYLSTPMHGDVHRRMRQYALYLDDVFRARQALRLVKLKLARQNRYLLHQMVLRPDLRHELHKSTQTLAALLADLQTGDWELERLRGMEGAAGAAYFAAFSRLFPPVLGFEHRHRRPPTDPVNACLSLGYTLLHHEAVDALRAVGLDPALGCLHDLYYQRDSLACDLLEPVRPWIDAWVHDLFHGRQLRAEDFRYEDGAYFLRSAGKQRFYEAYQQRVPAFRRLLHRYARLAERTVTEHEPC
ncbi:CRISPR-associated endonuclease Cas1 [Candidatus Methylomicrobium oryzae]|uniref:CRISPR-associated endonuclease Cas1 n=1 Tax=Candidatus Methylomicrobium oryzae TaxID=2802053 RepID=UPI0019226C1D|nr:CRISPR-associated endonuclease Cas1 [Methylomicrobium sp. RS1]MBL1266004.1 CRISPR-associated endonuclease Cas1 [Methylomicrobium sp. RS1]